MTNGPEPEGQLAHAGERSAPARRPRRSAGRRRPASSAAAPAGHTAEILRSDGEPALFIGGRRVDLLVDIASPLEAREAAAIRRPGPHVYRLRGFDPGWNGPSRFDHTSIAETCLTLLEADPAATYLLELRLDPEEGWLKRHPQECVRYAAAPAGEEPPRAVSWASQTWISECRHGLARLVATARASPWGMGCLGVCLTAGDRGAWVYPAVDMMPDVGPRMTEAFRAWASDRYRHNSGLLGRAWDDPRAHLGRIECPGEAERSRGDVGVFRDPLRSRRVLDYFECLCELRNDAILVLAGSVKSASGGDWLVGIPWAQVVGAKRRPEDGAGLPEQLLDSAAIDFYTVDLRVQTDLACVPVASLRLRGRLAMVGIDAAAAPVIAPAAIAERTLLAMPASIADAWKRGVSSAGGRTVRGHRLQAAIVVDASAPHYCASTSAGTLHSAAATAVDEATRCGAPWAVYLQSDLYRRDFPDARVYLFVNPYYVSDAERRLLDARIKRKSVTALWLWASGVIGETGIGAEQAGRVCGCRFRVEREATSLRVRIVEAGDPLTWGQHIGAVIGVETPLAPTITVPDRVAKRLGANSSNRTVFAAQRGAEWESVVYGTSPAPASLLRNALAEAGCHLYVETGTAVHGWGGLIALEGHPGAETPLSLPGALRPMDALTGRPAAPTGSEFTARLNECGVGLYMLRSG